MSGANHEMEHIFLDSLPLKDRPIAKKILPHYQLKEMIQFQQNGVPEILTNSFSRTPEQWKMIINKVILTKASYFTPTDKISLEHIELLTKIVCFALERPGTSLIQIKTMLNTSHVFFSNWAAKLNEIREEKLANRKLKKLS